MKFSAKIKFYSLIYILNFTMVLKFKMFHFSLKISLLAKSIIFCTNYVLRLSSLLIETLLPFRFISNTFLIVALFCNDVFILAYMIWFNVKSTISIRHIYFITILLYSCLCLTVSQLAFITTCNLCLIPLLDVIVNFWTSLCIYVNINIYFAFCNNKFNIFHFF